MLTTDPYGISHVTRPGHGEPEPLEPVHTADTPEHMAKCLDCPVQPDCNMRSPACPIYGSGKPAATSRRARMDGKIRDLINAGWRNNEAICEELGICKSTLTAAKRRLRERGEIG